MNKRILKTALFMIGGCILLLLITFLLWLIPNLIVIIFFGSQMKNLAPYLISITPIVALIGGFFIYNEIYKKVVQKIDMEKHFHSILWKKND